LNELAKFAVETLHQYAEENMVLPRSTSDLSKLEEWLIIKLFGIRQAIRITEEDFKAKHTTGK